MSMLTRKEVGRVKFSSHIILNIWGVCLRFLRNRLGVYLGKFHTSPLNFIHFIRKLPFNPTKNGGNAPACPRHFPTNTAVATASTTTMPSAFSQLPVASLRSTGGLHLHHEGHFPPPATPSSSKLASSPTGSSTVPSPTWIPLASCSTEFHSRLFLEQNPKDLESWNTMHA